MGLTTGVLDLDLVVIHATKENRCYFTYAFCYGTYKWRKSTYASYGPYKTSSVSATVSRTLCLRRC